MDKNIICEAFCDALDIRPVPAGYAITTPYGKTDGDRILIYFVRDERNRWRLEDDGTQIPLLEANGVDLSGRQRGEAFQALLDEYDAFYNKDSCTLHSSPLTDSELGRAAVRFIGLLLRLQDLVLLTPQIVRSTFRADALAAIHEAFNGKANVEERGIYD